VEVIIFQRSKDIFIKFNHEIKSQYLISFISLGLVLFYNLSFFENVSKHYLVTASNMPFYFSLGLLLFAIHCLVMLLFDFPFIFKLVVIPVIMVSSTAAYVMDSFHYMIDYQVFQIILEADFKEAMEFINIYMLLYVSLLGVLPSLLLFKTKIVCMNWKNKIKFGLFIFVLLGGNIGLMGKEYASFFRNHKPVRYFTNPITYIYSMIKFTKIQFKNRNIEFSKIALDAKRSETNDLEKKKLVILVIGETARAHNFSLNGYKRDTNPLLSQRTDIVSLRDAYSCGTETSKSLPCMLSKFNRKDFTRHRGKYFENVLDVLKRMNVRVQWRDNDSGCKGLCDRVEYLDLNLADIKPHCKNKDCFDEVLLYKLQEFIDEQETDTIIVLHKKGNHGPAYFKRYPKKFEKFTPTCLTERLQDCETKYIVNAYDNIIHYTDFFLNSLIEKLKMNEEKFDPMMIYVSDHGESLGEGGVYLHAMPYWIAPKVQKHIPFIFWGGEYFKEKIDQLRLRENETFSHDNLFHTLIGLFNVQTKEYNKSLDLLK
jgi:lipid A ethanolaminephosphotransferase